MIWSEHNHFSIILPGYTLTGPEQKRNPTVRRDYRFILIFFLCVIPRPFFFFCPSFYTLGFKHTGREKRRHIGKACRLRWPFCFDCVPEFISLWFCSKLYLPQNKRKFYYHICNSNWQLIDPNAQAYQNEKAWINEMTLFSFIPQKENIFT